MQRSRQASLVAAIALCLVLALGGQAAADAVVADASGADTGRAVGRAASSYVTGLRTYAAALLWLRIDPLMHGYYSEVALQDMRFMLSTISAVEALDPHFIQSYYVGAWILAQNDRVDDAVAMAGRGVSENPDSGLLRVNLAQILMLHAEDLPAALEQAEQALEPATVWTDDHEKHSGYPILGAIFRAAGRDDLDAIVQEEIVRLDEALGDELEPEDHDHDGDGVPDH
jgi:tetratricopeptide (TPR) repeat protein